VRGNRPYIKYFNMKGSGRSQKKREYRKVAVLKGGSARRTIDQAGTARKEGISRRRGRSWGGVSRNRGLVL